MPRSRLARTIVGLLLLIGGILGFLPVLGFWMIPLGLIVLSVDFPAIRRFRRRLVVRWGRTSNHVFGNNANNANNAGRADGRKNND